MRSFLRPLPAWLFLVLPAALPLGAVAVASAPATAATPTTLERPVFDRDATAVMIPFQGPLPSFTTAIEDGGTRLVAEFARSKARNAVPYKLGVFHPVVSRVEMANLPENEKVRLTIRLSEPSRLSVMPDGKGRLRLQIGAATSVDLAPAPMAYLADQPGQTPLTRAPLPHQPQPGPSVPPVLTGARTGTPLEPGAPITGTRVYRQAVTAPPGPGVTEVQVRSEMPSRVAVNRDPISDAVVVNLRAPGAAAPAGRAGSYDAYAKRPDEPWRAAAASAAPLVFRPMPALDSALGVMLLMERASSLGSDTTGMGSTLLGVTGHLPVREDFNISLGAEGFAYTIGSTQIPGHQTRRDEFFFRLQTEYLPIRSPWVLAFGPGYWTRMVQTSTNALPPTTSSLMFGNLLHHGPAANARVFYPLWGTLAGTAEVAGAPYLLGGDALGGLYGYQGALGLKWGTRHFGLSGGWRVQGYGAYTRSFTFLRTGPEVSLIWRF